MTPSNVLVTGASGFVGGALCRRLVGLANVRLTEASRIRRADCYGRYAKISGLDDPAGWSAALRGIDVVVHCAGHVHVMNDQAETTLHEYRKVNVRGTALLAEAAAKAGARRFIFISSIKALGESSEPGISLRALDTPHPQDFYGISKLEAERALGEIAEANGMDYVIIRPVLIYGPGVKANFLSMMQWLQRGIPLPLGSIDNRRSLVALDNLVDLIITCVEHPAAANQVFLVSDGEDLSTPELLRRMGHALGKPARLLPVPAFMLKAGARLLGKGAAAQRLCGSLQVDIGKTRQVLGWEPPVKVDEALRKTALDFLKG